MIDYLNQYLNFNKQQYFKNNSHNLQIRKQIASILKSKKQLVEIKDFNLSPSKHLARIFGQGGLVLK